MPKAYGLSCPRLNASARPVAVLGPAIDRAVGLMRLWEGDAAAARPSLERAPDEYERLGNPFEAARTREYLASALPAKERAPVLDAARRQYERLGATPSVQRVRSAAVLVFT